MLMLYLAIVLVAGVCAIICWALLPVLWRRFQERRLTNFCAANRALVLTFDDGPGSRLTPRLLDLLAHHRARATFFLLGRRLEHHYDIADRIVEAGHEIGNHGYGHLHAWTTPPGVYVRDYHRSLDLVSRWLSPTRLFRPPYGKASPLTSLLMARTGFRAGWWTIDGGDTWVEPPAPEAICERIRVQGGGVLLLHDFDRGPDTQASREAFVVELVGQLLEMAARERFQVMTLGEVAGQ